MVSNLLLKSVLLRKATSEVQLCFWERRRRTTSRGGRRREEGGGEDADAEAHQMSLSCRSLSPPHRFPSGLTGMNSRNSN